jgi:hypothetical protein
VREAEGEKGETIQRSLQEGEEVIMVKRLLPFVLATSLSLFFAVPALAAPAPARFGLQRLEVSASNRDGSPDVQAGSHPYALTTKFLLNKPEEYEPEQFKTPGDLKDVRFELPPGFVGNPDATPKCSYATFTSQGECPNDTAVGTAVTFITTSGYPFTGYLPHGVAIVNYSPKPVYNIEPSPGTAAEFGFLIAGSVPIFLDVSVRTGGDYGVTVNTKVPQAATTYGATVKIWGVPADPSHDPLRGKCFETIIGPSVAGGTDGLPGSPQQERELEEQSEQSRGNCPVNVPVQPLLTNPTSCGVPRNATMSVDSWQQPGSFDSKTVMMPELSGCETLDFSPSITVSPDGTAGSTPTGLNVDLHVPQESTTNPDGLAEADVKNTKVALPAGVQISPSAADGLMACSPAQINLHSPEPPTCPDASKVGTVQITTPLLPEQLTGAVYLASQDDNPFGSLIALYVVAENKVAGVRVKVAGQVTPDPITGQLVTTFKETPQLPFSDFKLSFFGTARAPLSTPPLCGTYTTETSIEPWTETQPASPSSKFQITSGPAGSPCADPLPFSPGFQAGSTNLQAGAFTPFTLTMTRPDGNETLSKIEMQMPPGLLGTLSNVKLCGEPQASQGTCGEDSLIGHTVVSAGLGNDPYTVTGGKVFITTGYKGAAYGLSIVNPAKAGPFDLGTVVVRAAINVDPHTAALHIVSDPLPTILDGIPLQIQHVNVTVDRDKFTFNPTNCNKMQIVGTLSSTEGATSQVSTPFQVTNCATLAFKPKFAVSTSGKTSRANGASLHVKLTYPTGPYDANIAKVKVDLPKQLPSRLTTLQKACPAATFGGNPAACPSASIVGQAKATTPVLPVVLEGPAYFVSHGGEEFPQLIVVLQGYGTTVDLVGSTFISKAGITSSTFRTVPDVPVGTFELTLPQGKYSALAAPGNLCKTTLKMPTAFTAQNGATIKQSTPISVTGCAKKKAKRAGKRHKGSAHGKK